MNSPTANDLTTSGQLETTSLSVEDTSQRRSDETSFSMVHSVEEDGPLHIPRNAAMEEDPLDWWSKPTKIGSWKANDVLSVPDAQGRWIYEPTDFADTIAAFMNKYGKKDYFPYVMMEMWNKPPSVPARFRFMWYDMVVSCIPPSKHDNSAEMNPMSSGKGAIPDEEFRLANRCVAIVSQWQQLPIIDGYKKALRNMRNYEEQAKMLGTQFPVIIGLLAMV